MKRTTYFIVALIIILFSNTLHAQKSSKLYKMESLKTEKIIINETFTSSVEIFPFEKNNEKIYGLAVSADIDLENEESIIRLLLVDSSFEEYLIFESYALLEETLSIPIEDHCEETAILEGIRAHSVKIEISGSKVSLKSFTISRQIDPVIKLGRLKNEKKQQQYEDKINRINKNLKKKGMKWVAGPTSVSGLSYSDRKKLYGESNFPPAFEYYSGGIISAGSSYSEESTLKSATSSSFVDDWDWRNRHGKNWITPVTSQGLCGSCWSFAAVGATEALTNLYFNQQLNLDLSEQDLISCSGAGSCSGGFPGKALTYITNTGIVDEGAFPYNDAKEPCESKSSSPSELIKISGKVDYGSGLYPRTEDDLKRLIIEMGPLSGGLYDWSHTMVLVGYKVVKEGDIFYYSDPKLKRYWLTIASEDPLIGKTVWIFKNSWSSRFGDEGYVYVETPITNMGWTHGLKTPVISSVENYEVICEDNDGDGYYWWGLGDKPATCDCPDEPDGDDSDPTLGPLDHYGYSRLLNHAPTADFTATNTILTEGETVNFTDLSSSNSDTWSWVFEGGTPYTSALKNPAVIYETAGVYSISLTVTNAIGADTKTMENFLTVEQANVDSAPQNSEFITNNEQVPKPSSGVKLYPNPVSENLVIETNSVAPGDSYTLYYLNGSKFKSEIILTKQTFVDFSNHAPGIYLIEISKNSRILREKIIKQ